MIDFVSTSYSVLVKEVHENVIGNSRPVDWNDNVHVLVCGCLIQFVSSPCNVQRLPHTRSS